MCVCVQSLLETRLPAQTNSLLANQKPLAADAKQGESAHYQPEHEASDPFKGKLELTGVGRSRLLQCSKAQLVAVCKSRGVNHINHLDVGKIVAKLEAWKRERSRTRREGPLVALDDDDDFASSHEETEERSVNDLGSRQPDATAAKEQGGRGEVGPTAGGEGIGTTTSTTPHVNPDTRGFPKTALPSD